MMKRRGYTVFRAVDLVVRYLLGELSTEEKKEYTQLLANTALDEKQWEGESLKQGLQKDNRFNSDEAYRQFLFHVSRKSFNRKLHWLKFAALWLLPLFAGSMVWYLWEPSGPEQKVSAQIFPVSSKAFIELADGRNIELTTLKDSLAEQDGTLIRQDSGKLVYAGNSCAAGQIIYNVLNVPRGGEYALLLSDGTKVWLNSDSRLRFPVQFSGKEREVFLNGEAYFEVSHDAEHPFIVHTSLGKVEVLGTEFNIQDYGTEQQVVTTLVSGKVKYATETGKDCMLKPGFQVVDNRKGGTLKVREVNLEEYVGWKEGLYTFYDRSLEDIMQTIQRNYDVQVFFENEKLKTLRFTGDLKKYDCVEKFLRFIEMGGDVTFVVKGKKILIEPK